MMANNSRPAVGFRAFFRQATGMPDPYQERLALSNPLPRLLDFQTGLGKTAAYIRLATAGSRANEVLPLPCRESLHKLC
jgi:hypothetical protein